MIRNGKLQWLLKKKRTEIDRTKETFKEDKKEE
jgi:hypothetical protein